MRAVRVGIVMGLAVAALAWSCRAVADDGGQTDPPRLESLLPPSVAKNVDVYAWGWLSALHSNQEGQHAYYDADLALGATARLGDRLAGTTDIHFWDANGKYRGFIEQAFVTSELAGHDGHATTLLTVGKFNANFGLEPRNAWDRIGGTTSLLFGAQPQDLVGAMVTQHVGSTITLRPFVTSNFDGLSDFGSAPSGGLLVEYQPTRQLTFSVTNWVGTGLRRPESEEYGAGPAANEEDDEYSNAGSWYPYGNWVGPWPVFEPGGTLYFIDGKVSWQARPDLVLGAEGLYARTGSSEGAEGWAGAMALANWDVTDRWRLFARWSFLNDGDGLVTGVAQRRHELSGGFGVRVLPGAELRVEYRHDFSSALPDLDAVSAHLTFAY